MATAGQQSFFKRHEKTRVSVLRKPTNMQCRYWLIVYWSSRNHLCDFFRNTTILSYLSFHDFLSLVFNLWFVICFYGPFLTIIINFWPWNPTNNNCNIILILRKKCQHLVSCLRHQWASYNTSTGPRSSPFISLFAWKIIPCL